MTHDPNHATLEEWAALNLYDAVMGVRAGLDGSADPIDPDEARRVLDVVDKRLREWDSTRLMSRVVADGHFKLFLEAAVAECRERLETAK